MNKPTAGLRHLALTVQHLEDCLHFYHQLLGMKIDWQPDPDNVYLTSGNDNLALHRASEDFAPSKYQRLDHLGFILNSKAEVYDWYHYLVEQQVDIKAKPRDHRDGARSFYCADPDGNAVQMMYHPALSAENT